MIHQRGGLVSMPGGLAYGSATAGNPGPEKIVDSYYSFPISAWRAALNYKLITNLPTIGTAARSRFSAPGCVRSFDDASAAQLAERQDKRPATRSPQSSQRPATRLPVPVAVPCAYRTGRRPPVGTLGGELGFHRRLELDGTCDSFLFAFVHLDHVIRSEGAGVALADLDLQGRVADLVGLLQQVSTFHEEFVAGMPRRDHQMAGHRGFGRADRPYVKIMDFDYTWPAEKERPDGVEVNLGGRCAQRHAQRTPQQTPCAP